MQHFISKARKKEGQYCIFVMQLSPSSNFETVAEEAEFKIL